MAATMHDPLNLGQIRSSLVGTRFAAHLHHFPAIGSTNTVLLEAAANGAPEGTVYLADEQTAGRGRGGHAWHSAPGEGLYLSVLVRPSLYLRDALLLSLATGLAASQALAEVSGTAIDIRWPNDLMLNNKKLGGVLVETAVEPGDEPRLRYAVIGIGLNLHHTSFPLELAALATSLSIEQPVESQPPTLRTPLVIALLRALDLELTKLEIGDTIPVLLERFASASTWARGKHVEVPEAGGYTGVTAGLNAQGYLLVDTNDGTRHTVHSGGVREAILPRP